LEGGDTKTGISIMKEKIYVPHLLIAAKPPMRNPREMSSSGFVNLNHVIEVKRGHEPRGEVTKR
jgi:hypothetical protein